MHYDTLAQHGSLLRVSPMKEIGDHLGHRTTRATGTYAKIDLLALREVGDFDLGDLE